MELGSRGVFHVGIIVVLFILVDYWIRVSGAYDGILLLTVCVGVRRFLKLHRDLSTLNMFHPSGVYGIALASACMCLTSNRERWRVNE